MKFVDHSKEVLAQMEANKEAALVAMGSKAEELILKKMQSGYKDPHPNRSDKGARITGFHTAIRQSGNLMGDVNYAVNNSAPDTVDIGNSLEYAPFVHEGTRYVRARPYIRDAIQEGFATIQRIAQSYLKRGF